MLWVCVLIIFSIVGASYYFKGRFDHMDESIDTLIEQMVISLAWSDRFDRLQAELKADFDDKLGADLAQKVKLILDAGKHPAKVMLGKDNKLHKINREY